MAGKHSAAGLYFVSIVPLALLVIFLIQSLTPYASATSPDSISYLDTAFNIKEGNGLVTTNVSFDAAGTNSQSPQRLWPPAYPALLSLFIESPFDVENVSVLSGILLLLSSTLIFGILRTAKIDWLVSLLISMLAILNLSMLLVYTYAWSETLFIPILLSMILVAFQYLRCSDISVRVRITLIGLFVILSLALLFTRYIGLAMILLFPLIYVLSNRSRSDKVIIFSGLVVYIVLASLFLAQNHQITGSISGGKRPPSSLTLSENLQHLAEAFSTIFPASLMGVGLGALLAGSALYSVAAAKKSWAANTSLNKLRLKYVVILGFVAVLYLSALVALRTNASFDQIDVRLIAPALPVTVLGLAILPAITVKRVAFFSVGMVSLSLIFMLAIRGWTGVTNTLVNWEKSGNPELPMRGSVVFNNFTAGPEGRQDAAALRSLVDEKGFLFIETPLFWRFITQRESYSIPSTIDHAVIDRLNTVPQGSLIIVSAAQAREMRSILARRGLEMQVVNMGEMVGVRLPFSARG